MAQRKLFQTLARLGYGARGTVYIAVAGFAMAAAFGARRQAKDSQGAFEAMLSAPLGGFLLGIVVVGLLCFAGWRVLQGIFDADQLGRQPKAVLRRLGYVGSTVVYVGLAIVALRLLIGSGPATSGEQAARDWTATLLSEPFGQALVGVLGLSIGMGGLGMASRGLRDPFRELPVGEARSWIIPVGRIGFVARGAVFVLVAGFLVVAAAHANAGEARGLAGALSALQRTSHGWILLAVTAIGLFAFGLFQILLAAFRRIETRVIEHAADRVGSQARKARTSPT